MDNNSLFGYPLDFIKKEFLVGLEFAYVTIGATIVLELLSLKTAKACYAKDKKLYLQGVAINLINHFVGGIPLYIAFSIVCMRQYDEAYNYWHVACQVAATILLHSFCYYEVHKTFHSCPGYYKYHKFHHRFNTHVTPISANAVSVVEYIFAYILPFAAAGFTVRPYPDAFRISIYILSISSLLIHTPCIEAWSERNMPEWLVSTHDHMEHHRKLNVHYAAPTVNLDYVVEKLSAIGRTKEGQNEAPSTGGR